MTNNQTNKTKILGSSMFNFISSMACKIVNPNAEDISDLNSDIKPIEDTLVDNFSNDLTLNKDIREKDLNKACGNNDFIFLSKAETEFHKNSTLGVDNFLKGCKWSPDGTCIMTCSDDCKLRLFDTNGDMLNLDNKEPKDIFPSLIMSEPEIIYDYAWYPFMDSNNPDTACLFSTCKDNPIHLFDAYTGQIRCSYKGYNHLEELVSAFSIAFNSTATHMYCGYNKCIKVFDLSRPGQNFQDIKVKTENFNLPGIISCIAFPQSSQFGSVFAVGSYSKNIALFDESTNDPVCLIPCHTGGLTHLLFSSDGTKLFSGARKDSDIICWDIRNPGQILQVFRRKVTTNQRIYFDLLNDKYLCSGNNDGTIYLWNANEFDLTKEQEPVLINFKAHEDCVNGVSFNAKYSLLASSSGQRKLTKLIPNYILNTKCSSDEEENDDDEIISTKTSSENNLKIWKHSLII